MVKDGWENINGVLHHQSLFYISEIIWTKFISKHYNDLLVGHFGIKKIRELMIQKYYWPILYHDIINYMKKCNICLALKAVRHKSYNDLYSLPIPTHYLKNLLIEFIMGLPISMDWEEDSYNSILVIINWLTKMVHYKLVKDTLNVSNFAEVIINIVIKHHGLLNSIITNWGLLFISKFWLSLCSFFDIKQKLSIAFYS